MSNNNQWDNFKSPNIYVTEVPKVEKKSENDIFPNQFEV